MAQVKDLPGDMKLEDVCVRIPDDYKEDVARIGLSTMDVYVTSMWSQGIWVKENLSSDRVFPLNIFPPSVKDWEVIPRDD